MHVSSPKSNNHGTENSHGNDRRCSFLGGDGTEEMTLYRVSGHLYTVSFDSNLGDVEVRRSVGIKGCNGDVDCRGNPE